VNSSLQLFPIRSPKFGSLGKNKKVTRETIFLKSGKILSGSFFSFIFGAIFKSTFSAFGRSFVRYQKQEEKEL